MGSAHIGDGSGIEQIRARLDALVRLRTAHGWTDAAAAEYDELVGYEAQYLAASAPLSQGSRRPPSAPVMLVEGGQLARRDPPPSGDA